MSDLARHPGISMHRLAVGGGIMGGLFAVGTVLIFVIGVPYGDWFLVGSFVLGAGIAAILHRWHQRYPLELADLHHPLPAHADKSR